MGMKSKTSRLPVIERVATLTSAGWSGVWKV
jgi:hypothetical protein